MVSREPTRAVAARKGAPELSLRKAYPEPDMLAHACNSRNPETKAVRTVSSRRA